MVAAIDNGPLIVRDEIPVLIVGGGPTGLLTASLLDRLGLRSLIIERHSTRLAAPKAHAVGPRSFDILRQYGFNIPLIRGQGTARQSGRWVHFVTTLAGETLGKLPYERMDVDVLDDTPEMFHNVPQPAVEQVIADTIQGRVEIRKHHSFVSCMEDDMGVLCTIEDRSTGELYIIRSKFMIACDGAKSKVRQCLGIESDGEDSGLALMTIEIDANLQPVVKDRQAILYWVINPEAHGTIIGYDLSKKQVMTCEFNPIINPPSTWDEARCRKILDAALGIKIPYSVKSFRPWIQRRQVAHTYRRGHIFLAGDAAHSFPPSAGIGLNSAIGDVHNLCWKIAALWHGWAGEKLIASYDTERRQIGVINSIQSVTNGRKIYGLIKELSFAESTPQEGWQSLRRTLADPVQRQFILEKIGQRWENFDNLELHIGYVYESVDAPASPSAYTPKYIKGARLPHLWIRPLTPDLSRSIPPVNLAHVDEFSQEQRDERQYSTLDLCQFDAFTIIINSNPSQLQRMAKVVKALKIRANGITSIPVGIAILDVDFEIVFPARATDWLEKLNLGTGHAGGVIVRPDQHILSVLDDDTSAQRIVDDLNHAAGF